MKIKLRVYSDDSQAIASRQLVKVERASTAIEMVFWNLRNVGG
jgi:hypothetical protein